MNYPDLILPSPVREITDEILQEAGVRLLIKRDDLIHPEISGNKWRKLKYNILDAKKSGAEAMVSFGGAYSNHLYALASFGQMAGIPTIGIVRGHELTPSSSPTLRHCDTRGMELHFVSREDYRQKQEGIYYLAHFGNKNLYVVPEGGSNEAALEGVGEIIDECAAEGILPDFFAVPSGTGGTAGGLLCRGQKVIAFAVLKGASFLKDDIAQWNCTQNGILDLQLDYHFGGYGKHTPELLEFINHFEHTHQIPLEQVYTGKMFFGLYDLIKTGYFAKGTTIVAVHTGGLQGKLKL